MVDTGLPEGSAGKGLVLEINRERSHNTTS
jgi:hypothetical protein